MTKLNLEQGRIRPPSEAYSLLLRMTRNCPWNRCEFCHTLILKTSPLEASGGVERVLSDLMESFI